MEARNQYLGGLQEEYRGAKREKKSELLDEAEKRTKLARKYLIRKLGAASDLSGKPRKKRRRYYDGAVKGALVEVWELFDYPCGQRLVAVLRGQLGRLRECRAVRCSEEVAGKLGRISAKTIDRVLGSERQRLRLHRSRGSGVHPLLYQQIPVKTSAEWDRQQLGNVQLDYVVHCGQSTAGHYLHTVSAADIASGWWEGEAILGRSQQATEQALERIRERLPFRLREIHPDNDSGLVNELIWQWCGRNQVAFSRSRPLKKNDNAWVEQKNWTHVRQLVGYQRYETEGERELVNGLYREWALWKNFFHPVMKLAEKRRVRGKVYRRYEPAQTPSERVRQSVKAPEAARLQQRYQALNPLALKRSIQQKQNQLFDLVEERRPKGRPRPTKRVQPSVRSFMTQQPQLRLHP